MMRPRSLLSLPAELHTAIAYELALSAPHGPPSSLTSLLLTHPLFNESLSFTANPSLYSAILHSSWDTAAVRRRFGADALADARVAAGELKKRWRLLHRIRAVATGDADFSGPGAREKAGRDMLAIWLLLTESDGLNLGHILLWANLPRYLLAYHQTVLLPAALEPDAFPAETLDNAMHVLLGTWLDELGYELRCAALDAQPTLKEGDLPNEPVDQIDEKLFVLRPFSLAPFKYHSTFAPWDHKTLLPVPLDGKHVPSKAMIDSVAPDNTMAIKRFGRDWTIRPPLIVSSAIVGVLNQLDRTPSIISSPDDPASASNSSTKSITFLYTGFGEKDKDTAPLYYDDDHGSVLRRSIPRIQLHSKYHDLDVRRSLLCSDLSMTPKLGPFGGIRGKVEGVWHGSYSFFDFAGFRGLLAGEDRNLHEGGVGQQAQEIVLTETVVRVPIHLLGGSGPVLNAGYPDKDAPPDPHETLYSAEEENAEEPEGSGFAKELLIHGWGRSRWGECVYRGRVRAYDGMITMVKEYTENALHKSKWFYRGYIYQDSRFVGVWRDTFSEMGSHGYESGFSHRKQSSEFLVPTQRMPPRDITVQTRVHPDADQVSAQAHWTTPVPEHPSVVTGYGNHGAKGEWLSPMEEKKKRKKRRKEAEAEQEIDLDQILRHPSIAEMEVAMTTAESSSSTCVVRSDDSDETDSDDNLVDERTIHTLSSATASSSRPPLALCSNAAGFSSSDAFGSTAPIPAHLPSLGPSTSLSQALPFPLPTLPPLSACAPPFTRSTEKQSVNTPPSAGSAADVAEAPLKGMANVFFSGPEFDSGSAWNGPKERAIRQAETWGQRGRAATGEGKGKERERVEVGEGEFDRERASTR